MSTVAQLISGAESEADVLALLIPALAPYLAAGGELVTLGTDAVQAIGAAIAWSEAKKSASQVAVDAIELATDAAEKAKLGH